MNNSPKSTTRTYKTTGYHGRNSAQKKHNQNKFFFIVILAVLVLALLVFIGIVIADIVGFGSGSTTTDGTDDTSGIGELISGHGMSMAYDGDKSTYMLSVTKQSAGSYFSCEFETPADVKKVTLASTEPDSYIRLADIQLKIDGEWITIGEFDSIGECSFSTGSASSLASAVRILIKSEADVFWSINELTVTDRSNQTVSLRSPSAGNNSGSITETEGSTTEEETTAPPPPDTFLKPVKNEELYTGSLILVNEQYAYHFPTSTANLLNLYNEYFANDYHCNYFEGSEIWLEAEATRALFAMLNAMKAETGHNQIIIGTGYRTYEEQQKIAAAYPDTAALPGYSEHHTALGIDMRGWIDNSYYNFDDNNPTMQAIFAWLNANAHKFGYVRRFVPEKDQITGVTTDRWHYRYVGIPHAYYMNENNLCLEEYLATLEANCKYGTSHLILDDVEGKSYEIYYVPAANGETTDIPLPADSSKYTISGNNYSGYIVTITRN